MKSPSTQTDYQVRTAQPSDKLALMTMIQNMADESEGMRLDSKTLEQSVQKVFDQPYLGIYWVLTHSETLIGGLLVTTEWSDWHNAPYWWIQSVYLHPDHRGKGQFQQLLSAVEQAARDAGSPELRLYVHTENLRAIRAYEKTGFSQGHYLVMTKHLP